MFERKIELIISFYNSWIVIVIWKIFITEILFKQERTDIFPENERKVSKMFS
jgi:hypothetical protein